MTDTYGNEPHEHDAGHDEIANEGHAEVHEVPSDYEFSDESATAEHSADQAASSQTGSAKGRSPLLPIAAAIGGVALLGAIAWWQFAGSPAAPAPQIDLSTRAGQSTMIAQAAQEAAKTRHASADPASPSTNASTSAPTAAPTSASQAGMPSEAPAASATTASSTQAMPAETKPPVQPQAAQPETSIQPFSPQPIASQPQLSSPTGTTATPDQAAPQHISPPTLTSPASITSSPTSSNKDNQRIDALSSRVDDLQKSLNQISQQLSQVTNMVAATTTAPTSAPAIDHEQPATPHVSKRHDVPPMHKPYVNMGHVRVKTNKVTMENSKKSHQHWVLRAATPDQAWVAANATDQNLKPLRVGDTLPGVGRITAIEPNDGSWIVQGTKGTIR